MQLLTNEVTPFVVQRLGLEVTRAGIQLLTGLRVEITDSDTVPRMALTVYDADGVETDFICEGDIVVVRNHVKPCYVVMTPELYSFLFQ